MDWRSIVLKHLGPGMLGGITFPDWLRLLRSEGASIDLACLPRAAGY
jgi:hypothetical protein